jgi:DNA phosphorothioation-dependent restriction protein DptG
VHRIIRIEDVVEYENKTTGKPFWRTFAVLDDGSEVQGYGKGFHLDQLVESWYNKEYDYHEMAPPTGGYVIKNGS